MLRLPKICARSRVGSAVVNEVQKTIKERTANSRIISWQYCGSCYIRRLAVSTSQCTVYQDIDLPSSTEQIVRSTRLTGSLSRPYPSPYNCLSVGQFQDPGHAMLYERIAR